MRVKLYGDPEGTGWLGWVEDMYGNALGYVKLDGELVWLGNRA